MKKILLTLTFFQLLLSIKAQWTGTNPIITNSKVGIGTTTPTGKLHINGTGDQDFVLQNAGIGFAPSNSGYADLILARWENYFLDLTNWGSGTAADATVFRISANQVTGKEATLALVRGKWPNVEFLDFYNNGYSDGLQYGIRIQKRGTGVYRDFVIDQYDGTTASPLMIFKANGYVGIGTKAPKYKLDVLGTIRAKEIKVDMAGADFVFENNYKLMPLSELELFVKERKHLPDVPSANDMEQNGTELGILNSILLKKIEELTLYTIEQNKKIIELEKQTLKIKDLEERIKAIEASDGKK